MRDRLRAVECPSDIIDAIGGWSTDGVGQSYGKGYDLNILGRWMTKIQYQDNRVMQGQYTNTSLF